jgi:hypothetical protein
MTRKTLDILAKIAYALLRRFNVMLVLLLLLASCSSMIQSSSSVSVDFGADHEPTEVIHRDHALRDSGPLAMVEDPLSNYDAYTPEILKVPKGSVRHFVYGCMVLDRERMISSWPTVLPVAVVVDGVEQSPAVWRATDDSQTRMCGDLAIVVPAGATVEVSLGREYTSSPAHYTFYVADGPFTDDAKAVKGTAWMQDFRLRDDGNGACTVLSADVSPVISDPPKSFTNSPLLEELGYEEGG